MCDEYDRIQYKLEVFNRDNRKLKQKLDEYKYENRELRKILLNLTSQ